MRDKSEKTSRKLKFTRSESQEKSGSVGELKQDFRRREGERDGWMENKEEKDSSWALVSKDEEKG